MQPTFRQLRVTWLLSKQSGGAWLEQRIDKLRKTVLKLPSLVTQLIGNTIVKF